jgi:hypothetical protein
VGIDFNALKTVLDVLGCRKLCARWDPGSLTPDDKEKRLQACANLLDWYETMGDVLHTIVTGDEIGFVNMNRIQSGSLMEWRHKYSLSNKFKSHPFAGRMM